MFNSQPGGRDALQLKDWAVITGAVEELQPYLLSETLHWNLTSREVGQVSLTPGLLLLASQRLKNARLSAAEQQSLEAQTRQWQAVRLAWTSAWQRKAQKESGERQRLVQLETEGWRDGAAHLGAFYQKLLYERVLLELLKQDLAEKFLPANLVLLDAWDVNFKNQTVEGAFAWNAGTEAAFSQDIFWFLYRTPLTRRK